MSIARRCPLALAAALCAAPVLLVGCGTTPATTGSPDGATASPDLAQAAASPDMALPAAAINAPKGKWTWVPIDGMVCDDGSPTGIGVYLTDSPNLLVFLNGGGACWDYSTCFVINTSTHGPFGQAQFDAISAQLPQHDDTVLSEGSVNPFMGWSKVYIPYCTGDLHAGDATPTFMGGGMSGTVHFHGYQNTYLALSRVGATVPAPAKMVFSGSSAGGYGATVEYVRARLTWPSAQSYLLDDSGPVLIDAAISDFLKMGWEPTWNLDNTVFQWCPDCKGGDWSLIYSTLAKRFPNDRMALLETQQDQTISGYLLLGGPQFQADLTDLATTRLAPLPNFRTFIEPGKVHTMLGNMSTHMSNGVQVSTFIKQMVTDDPSWKSVAP